MATKVATGRFLNVHFKPSLREVQQDFHRLKGDLSHTRAVMGVAMGIAEDEIEEMFDEKRDAVGKPWAPWKETYPPSGATPYGQRARALPNVNGILERTRPGLRDAATSSSAFVITDNRLTYGSDLPEWAGVHLHGGKKVFNGGYKIPQRSFYPYSAAGVARVKSVFDAWADESIAVLTKTSSRGRTFTQVQTRTPGGQFGTKPF
jgi:phage gpG-like protein